MFKAGTQALQSPCLMSLTLMSFFVFVMVKYFSVAGHYVDFALELLKDLARRRVVERELTCIGELVDLRLL